MPNLQKSCVAFVFCSVWERLTEGGYRWGLDGLRGVQQARHMVVDGLVHNSALLEVLDLVVHQLKVLCLGVKCCYSLLLTAVAIQGVVIIQANDGSHVGDEGIRLWVSACSEHVTDQSSWLGNGNGSFPGRLTSVHRLHATMDLSSTIQKLLKDAAWETLNAGRSNYLVEPWEIHQRQMSCVS